ncbi:hypothetical protein GGR52DRAFT_587593 [Hypoxylon sp. FL1284]|nr:hypothetical protein GGR52DRAFT_587593 [Hypoxylon sp. FL1284]
MVFINLMPPQSTVWFGPQPGDVNYTPESQLRSDLGSLADWQVLCQQLFENECPWNSSNWGLACLCDSLLSQQLQPCTMEDQAWFQPMAVDSGDEAYTAESLYNDSIPRADANSPYAARLQTPAAGVSAVNHGREFGPSHSQHSNKELAGSDQIFLPTLPTTPVAAAANGYSRGFGASYDSPQYLTWPAYSSSNTTGAAGYLDFSDGLHGLSGSSWHHPSNVAVFGEPMDGPSHVSPSSFSSSTPSESYAARGHRINSSNSNINIDTSSAAIMNSGGSADVWGASGCSPATISPKMLRIRPSPTPASSTESIRNSQDQGSGDVEMSSPVFESYPPPPPPHNSYNHHRQTTTSLRSPFSPRRPSPKPRKELPTMPPKRRHHGSKPASASAVSAASSSSTSRRLRDRRPVSPPQPQPQQRQPARPRSPPRRSRAAAARVVIKRERDLDEVLEEEEDEDDVEGSSDGGRGAGAGAVLLAQENRAAKDEYLVRSKRAGMTYREIREAGDFKEAESTLRGRFRTLTKSKEARVRKPEWQDNDVRLLRRAVRKLFEGEDMARARAPWGQVANYIADHGSSYHFGSATCHRKWKELLEDGLA